MRVGSIRLMVSAALTVALLAGCGSDDEQSDKEQWCAAGDSLSADIGALKDLDLVAEGTDGLESALTEIENDVKELYDNVDLDGEKEDIDLLQEAIDGLDNAMSGLSGDITSENVEAVQAAVVNVGNASSLLLNNQRGLC